MLPLGGAHAGAFRSPLDHRPRSSPQFQPPVPAHRSSPPFQPTVL